MMRTVVGFLEGDILSLTQQRDPVTTQSLLFEFSMQNILRFQFAPRECVLGKDSCNGRLLLLWPIKQMKCLHTRVQDMWDLKLEPFHTQSTQGRSRRKPRFVFNTTLSFCRWTTWQCIHGTELAWYLEPCQR